MRRGRARALYIAANLALGITGCGAILETLPKVVAAVTDGMQILDAIDAYVDAYFSRHPDATQQAKVKAASLRARLALNVALRSANGATNLNNAQVDAAFIDFREAYVELLRLVSPLGVQQIGTRIAVRYGDHLAVPAPMAMSLLVRR